jgi:hypothetical protein
MPLAYAQSASPATKAGRAGKSDGVSEGHGSGEEAGEFRRQRLFRLCHAPIKEFHDAGSHKGVGVQRAAIAGIEQPRR